MYPSFFARLAAFALLLLFAAAPARAIDPALSIAQLHHDRWTSKDGMPGDVWDMTQDRDGFLWFATTSGLYRFDGVRFEHVRALGGQPLRSNVMVIARAFSDGALWISYRFGGLAVWQNGVLRHFGAADGFGRGVVHALERDNRGRVWVALGAGIRMYDGARWQTIGADWGLPAVVQDLRIDAAGRVWAGTAAGLYRLDPGERRFAPAGYAPTYTNVIDAPDGGTWLDGADNLLRVPGGVREPHAVRLPYAWDAVFDRDGNLWEAACDGLCRITPSELATAKQVFPRRGKRERLQGDALSGDAMIVMEDREGDIWVGTRNGVDRFRHNRVVPLDLPRHYSYAALALDGADNLWVRAETMHAPRLWRREAGAMRLQPERDVTALATAVDGALLLARAGRLERRLGDARRFIAYPAALTAADVTILLDDGAGIWAAFHPGGLYHHADGQWQPARDLGLPDMTPTAMTRDRGGALWFGYRDSSVAVIAAGAVRRYGPADGLNVGVIGHVADAGATHLVAGDTGLALQRGRRFVPVTLADPQALAGVTGIVASPDGDLWLNGSQGLVHIPAAAWRNFMHAPDRAVAAYELFDAVDGYPGIAQFGAGARSLLQDATGRLWLAGSTGAASLDPRHVPRNRVAPPIHILGGAGDGRAFGAGAVAHLASGTRNLQLAYTAPSFTMPERVRFRYRLDGADADGAWIDAGTRRTAYYNNLGPGHYSFQVLAANEDGVWSPVPATMALRIPPTFIQSDTFEILCVLTVIAAAWLLMRLRLRRATAQLRRLLQERAGERERIARTLHDTLMQSVQALLMLFERARDQLPPSSGALPVLDRTLGQARATLSEGRDELSALRGATAPERDLIGALVPLGHILGAQFGVQFTVQVHGARRALCRDVAVEACFIAREALQNAFRHARATLVTLDVDFGADAFILRVRDDGRGIAPDAARPGHWGLAGMRERAAAIEAELVIRAVDAGAAAASGTLVELAVPAMHAYEAAPHAAWWRRRAFFSRGRAW